MADYLADAPKKKITTLELVQMKRKGQKIVMITAYDALFGALVDAAGVDVVLVGDSVAPVLAGEETTIPATVDQMIYHGKTARRGIKRALVVVDLPFLSYQVSIPDAIANAGRILKETGAAAVKLEGGATWAPTVAALVNAGIPVMGHLGFTPQSVHQLGGFKIQGKQADAAARLVEDAKALEQAGAFAMVLELMPGPVAKSVTAAVGIPTIGIGAGPDCDGQVLVLHDMLGLNEGFAPKFLKRYAELGQEARAAIGRFGEEVRSGAYPGPEHTHGG
ncbi:MAG: 3-methyl-2-oxobutanoate hydroxymethyltransferase [Gemmatimonadales bacterium]|nr:3-methyl-2-oxobutanoate hydroxymethyltransferase [Gemmatimonadales bacterium]